jgi:hypothetical protein
MTSPSDPRQLRMHPSIDQLPLGKARDTWLLPDGTLWCEIHLEGSRYRMRFPEMADFVVDANGVVECYPVPGADTHTLEHLHLNQVIPSVLSLQHRPVFHAGAVAMGDGAAAFVGVSGRGKSTLVTYLALNGHALLTDDGMELATDTDELLVRPAHPSVRLWEDSRLALLPDNAKRAPALPYTVKERFIDDSLIPCSPEALPLRRAYFLGEGTSQEVCIEPLSAQEAHMAWVRHAFVLDPHDPTRMRSLFAQVAALAEHGISYRLDYPRRYEALPDVRAALLAQADAVTGRRGSRTDS